MPDESKIHLESLPDAVVIVDAQGRIVRVNSHTEKLLGYDRHELIGQRVELLVPERARGVHEEHREGYAEAPHVRGMGAGLALSARRKDGREVPVEIMLSPGAGGSTVAVVRDITKRRELERFRDEYVGYISHDLKNPLSIISLQARLLSHKLALRKDAAGAAEEREMVDIIEQSAAFIDRMVREMLEMSYLESDRVELETAPADLAKMLEDVLVRTVSTVDRWRVRLEIRDQVTATIDATRIERVVVNFVQNALKYAPPDSVVLVRLEAQAGMAVVSVIDEGPGLSADEVAYVFEKYRRTRTAKRREGLGLGLYISRKIIEAHDGRIGVHSEPDRGATFFFKIPSMVKKRAEDALVITLDRATVPHVGDTLLGARILLVDDEVNAVSALGQLLVVEGLAVMTATSGDQALAMLADGKPDAVVLDVEMPGMNGPALLTKIRQVLPGVPAVFMTGYMAHHAGIAEARAATGAAYVGKPVDVDELVRVLARLIVPR